jgi:hypothetical protein
MMRYPVLIAAAGAVGLLWAVGCGQTEFPAALDPTLEQVNQVSNSDTLDPQEKRAELAKLGINETIINGLLREERLANQYGARLQVGSSTHTGLAAALYKVENEMLRELTPDEVQYYGDGTEVIEYTDEEAQAIVDFFEEAGLKSPNELEDYLDDPTTGLPTAIDETTLRDVFIDTSPDDVRDKLP